MTPEDLREKIATTENDECWPISGRATNYAQIIVDGKNRRAAHLAWEFYHGRPFPKGRESCHTCDNPPCVNPRHIYAGTHSENIKQAWDRGRYPVREPKPRASRAKPKEWRQCVRCKRAFKPQRSTARYCSAKCRVYAARGK